MPVAADAAADMAAAHVLGNVPELVIEAELVIEEPQSETRRGVMIYYSSTLSSARMLAQITSPAFLRNLKFLLHRDGDGQQQSWMRTSRGVRRLTSGGNDQRVFSSHFRAQDFSWVDQDSYRVEYDSPQESRTRIRVSPQGGQGHVRVFTIDREDGLVTHIEYYAEGNAVREYRVVEYMSVAGTRIPARAVMEDYESGGRTTLVIGSADAASRIPDRTFNPAGL